MSRRFVVDTNVPVVANGRIDDFAARGRTVSRACRLAAIEFLEKLLDDGKIVLDRAGEIQAEYHRHLSPRGQPGVGDRFYLEVLNSAPRRVMRIELAKTGGDFDDFPNSASLRNFDPSDRKFVAAAVNANAAVANAVDGDSLDYRQALRRHNIKLKFVCSADKAAWFEERS